MGPVTASRGIAARPRVGNAPVSWGVYEAGDGNIPFQAVLDQIAQAGYEGTELGPYGYLPTDPDALARELQVRRLTLASSFVPLPLDDATPERLQSSIETAMKVARLLASQGVCQLIVADDEDPERARIAGRVPEDGRAGWTDADWARVRGTLHTLATELREQLGMHVVVHHHAGTFIETPDEVERLLRETDPELVGLLLDTGHLVYGGGDPEDLLRRHGERVRYVHVKDVDAAELRHARRTEVPMGEAWRRGIFCPLGHGMVDIPRVVEELRARQYDGWIIVEQDVVPDEDGRLFPGPAESAHRSRAYLRDKVGL